MPELWNKRLNEPFEEDRGNTWDTTDFEPEIYTFSNYIVDQKLLKDGREPTLEDMRFLWSGHGVSYKTYCKNHDYESENVFI